MFISPVFFYVFAAVAIACSLLVILKKSPVTSAFSLVVVLFAFAGIYALLDAHLLAALQILVYAGAIMVLFVFVIMLLNSDAQSLDLRRGHPAIKIAGALACLGLLAMFVWAFRNSPETAPVGKFTSESIEASGGNTQVISEMLFSDYILPFELTSVLLLGAIVGAVAMAKRKGGQSHAS
jgi:NADH-quinone oxidoreductase subunit J